MSKKLTQNEAADRFLCKNLHLLSNYQSNNIEVEALCYCNTKFKVLPRRIFNNHTKSCGCLRGRNLVNQKFGRLLVIENTGRYNKNGNVYWKCKCDCGNDYVMISSNLVPDSNVSCGCVYSEFKKQRTGDKNPNWNPNLTNEDRINRRQTLEHINWSNKILNKYNYICQICFQKGGKLHAHHLYNWASFPEKRFDINNGICLCIKCHRTFHSIYGIKINTKEQFLEFKIGLKYEV